jgi:hypothetical protein
MPFSKPMVWNVAKIGTKHSDPVLGPPNGMDRSCAATIYPVLDKPRNSVGLGPRGHLLEEICPLVFKISFTIRLDRR